MFSRLKFVLVWLIALALPVQALASATMLHCGPGHHRVHAAQMGTAPDVSAHHDHAQHQAASSPSRGAGRTAPMADLGKYKCSACAACGSACALPSSMPVIEAPEFGATVFVVVVPAVEAFAVDGPDRPPRSVLVWRRRVLRHACTLFPAAPCCICCAGAVPGFHTRTPWSIRFGAGSRRPLSSPPHARPRRSPPRLPLDPTRSTDRPRCPL